MKKTRATPFGPDHLFLGAPANRETGVKEHALGYPLGASIEDPKAVNGRLNKAKHVRFPLS